MSLRAEMKKYFIHEKADFIDDKEAVTDFDNLEDRDIDNDGDTDDSDEYLHKRFGTIAKANEISGDAEFASSAGDHYVDGTPDEDWPALVASDGVEQAALEYVATYGDSPAEELASELLITRKEADDALKAIAVESEDITGMGVAIWMAGKDYPGYGTAKKVKRISDDRVEVTFRDGNTYTFVLEPGYETWVEESVTEINTSSATPGYDTPNAFGDADEDTIEADGWKKAPKTNRIFKPMEGKSTFKKMMAEMYGLKEAAKYDIEAAVRRLREFNRGNYKSHKKLDMHALAVDILQDLGIKPVGHIVAGTIDHLQASMDDDKIPEDPDIVRELYPLLEAVNYDVVKTMADFLDDSPAQIKADVKKHKSIKKWWNAYKADALEYGTLYDLEIKGFEKEFKQHLKEAVSYREYKKDPNSTPKQKVNKGIAEVNKMLSEMEKIVNNNLRLKQETGVDSSHFWKSTGKRFAKINERMTRISNRLKELSK